MVHFGIANKMREMKKRRMWENSAEQNLKKKKKSEKDSEAPGK